MTEIIVWVNGTKKRVSGLARSTTCQDVITLLLKDHLKSDHVLQSYSSCFALYERWRGCERVISPRTRLCKLWKAWDHEQKNVRFTLKRSTSGEPHPDQIGGELIGQDSAKPGPKTPPKKGPISVENKKVRSGTVRPLRVKTKTHRSGADSSGTRHKNRYPESSNRNRKGSKEDLETLVQTVVEQSKRLQDLLEKIHEIDSEIEFYETKAHMLRVEKKGKNYVQDAYLSRLERDTSQSEDTDDNLCELVSNGCSDLETYISLYENLLDVESKLTTKKDTIAELTETIERKRLNINDDSLTSDPANGAKVTDDQPLTYDEFVARTYVSPDTNNADHQREIGLVRAQLEWYTDVCIAQKSEITTMHHRLASAETLYNDKHHWLEILVNELERLETSSPLDEPCVEDTDPASVKTPNEEAETEYVETVDQVESKVDDGHDSGICMSPDEPTKLKNGVPLDNDSSSDTGLSSLHSQDDSEHSQFQTETLV